MPKSEPTTGEQRTADESRVEAVATLLGGFVMETGNHHEEVRGAIAFLRSIPLRISALESELAEARCKNAKTARLVRDAVREKIGAKHENSRAQTRVRELEEENARLGGVVSECAQLLPIAGPLPDRVHFLRTSHDQLSGGAEWSP